jgi:hypothetical protein
MSDHFVEALAVQLREAAERERRRTPLGRRLAGLLALPPRLTLAAVTAAAVLLAILLSAAYLVVSVEPDRVARPAPRIAATLTPSPALGAATAAFGSVWVDDTDRHQLLRMDPASRRVTARIPLDEPAALAAGHDALWALILPRNDVNGVPGLQRQLVRIDPRTNRVAARIALTSPGGQPRVAAAMHVGSDAIWAFGPTGAVRVDPRTNRAVQAITVPGRYELSEGTVAGQTLWLVVADGRLLGYDARTGKPTGAARIDLGRERLAPAGRALLVIADDGVTRVDPRSGSVQWRTTVRPALDSQVREPLLAESGGRLWMAAYRGGAPDLQLVGLDPQTGEIGPRVALPEVFSISGLTAVDGTLWVTSPSGQLFIVRP